MKKSVELWIHNQEEPHVDGIKMDEYPAHTENKI